jgi:hypothetical protein
MTTISTKAELVTAIEAFATYDQSAYIDYFIAWAHQEITRRLRCNTLLTSADVTVSAETASLPTRFAALKRFYLDTSPRTQLTLISPEGVQDRIAQSASQTYPEVLCVEGSSFRFGPIFTGSATGKCLYYQAPATLSADGDTNTVLTAYPFLYLWGSLEALYRFMEDDNNADRYGALFGALIEDVNGKEAADAMSGPLQMQNAPQRVV